MTVLVRINNMNQCVFIEWNCKHSHSNNSSLLSAAEFNKKCANYLEFDDVAYETALINLENSI